MTIGQALSTNEEQPSSIAKLKARSIDITFKKSKMRRKGKITPKSSALVNLGIYARKDVRCSCRKDSADAA
jgi:hypothetical protein